MTSELGTSATDGPLGIDPPGLGLELAALAGADPTTGAGQRARHVAAIIGDAVDAHFELLEREPPIADAPAEADAGDSKATDAIRETVPADPIDARPRPVAAPARDETLASKDRQIAELDAHLAAANRKIARFESLLALAGAPSPAAEDPAPPDADRLVEAFEALSAAMNRRLDRMSKQLGVSSAVETDDVRLDALFAGMDEADVESNLDAMQVREHASGEVRSNVDRLRKLQRGDG